MLLRDVLSTLYQELSVERQREILEAVQTNDVQTDSVLETLLYQSYLKVFAIMTIEERLGIYTTMVEKQWLDKEWNDADGQDNKRFVSMMKRLASFDTGTQTMSSNAQKVWELLSDPSSAMQNQAIVLFESLTKAEQREITSSFVQIEGRSPYLVHDCDFEYQTIERTAFLVADQDCFKSSLYTFVDWMMAISGDVRWLNATKLHVQHMMCWGGFSQQMVEQLLTHLLHHPNLEELYLMNGYHNAIDLLEDFRQAGVQGETVEETMANLGSLKSFKTQAIYHPFLSGFSLEELILEDKGTEHRTGISAHDTFNRLTDEWQNPYWSDLSGINVGRYGFKKLRKLHILNSNTTHLLFVDSEKFKELHVDNCTNLQMLKVLKVLDSLYIDKCPALYHIETPKPYYMFLGHDLLNGLGPKFDAKDPDWHQKFALLQQRQDERVHILQKAESSEGNRYFYQYAEWLDGRCYYSPTWMLEQIRALFVEGTPFTFVDSGGLYALYAGENIIGDLLLWESRSYSGWEDFADEGHDLDFMMSEVRSAPTLQNPLSDAIVKAMADLLSDRPEWEQCKVSEFMRHQDNDEVAIPSIFTSIEAEQFWAWIKTMPQEFQDAVEDLE